MGLTSACNHLYYYPDSEEYRSPDSYTFPVSEVYIPRPSKEPLHAWVMNDAKDSKGFILHFHGNAQNLTAHAGFSDWFAKEGYTVLIFDYSGYGKTPGKPSQDVLIEDSRAVARYVLANEKWQKLPFIVFAQSLGGAVAVTTLAEDEAFAKAVDLLVVESSFDSYRNLARAKMLFSPLTWLLSPLTYLLIDDYRSPADAIAKLKMPKIIVHGSADQVVFFKSGKALYEAASPPKEFWEIPFGNHTEGFILGSPYRAELLERFQKL